ncbi:MAG: hypothetical protein ACOYM3_34775, partial [Terrimicrobiaceae bacterium]
MPIRCSLAWQFERIRHFIPGLLVFLIPSVLEAKSDFEHPNSFIGNAGWSGGLELWIEVGEIPVGDGVPLRLRFASDVTRENSLFGDHWRCPLLESEGGQSENYIEWTTLGGGKKFLLKSGESEFRSKDRGTTAHEVGGTCEIASEGWRYQYKDGKIVEAITPDGKRLSWEYQDGFPTGIRRVSDKGVFVEKLPGKQRIGWKPMPHAVVAWASCPWLAPAPVISINRAGDETDLLNVSRTTDSVKIHGAFGDFLFRTDLPSKDWFLKFPDGRETRIKIVP